MDLNKESLSILISKLESYCKNQKIGFPEEIDKLKNLNAAKGKLRSGGTIKESCQILEEQLDLRKDFFFRTLKELPLEYKTDLEQEIDCLLDKYVPVDFSDFRSTYLDVLNLAAKDNKAAHSKGLELAEAGNGRIREQLSLEIKQYLHVLKNNTERSKEGKIYIFAELILLVVTAFLAGMWATDSGGNYEPWIVLSGVSLTILDIIRRYRAKNA